MQKLSRAFFSDQAKAKDFKQRFPVQLCHDDQAGKRPDRHLGIIMNHEVITSAASHMADECCQILIPCHDKLASKLHVSLLMRLKLPMLMQGAGLS